MYNVYTWYKQLSQQVFVVDRETQMQDSGTSLCPLLLGTIWTRMQAVPVQKMEIFFMPGQMLKIQRRPSTSFSKAWRARRKLVSTGCLYVAPAANMVGRVPLIPLFLAGNTTPTIPHKYSWESVTLQQRMAGVAAMRMR